MQCCKVNHHGSKIYGQALLLSALHPILKIDVYSLQPVIINVLVYILLC